MPQLIVTSDGSHSLKMDDFEESYHSRHGALTESLHVFIEYGLKPKLEKSKSLVILEVGLGTGLNCLLSMREVKNVNGDIRYVALEPYPINVELASELNYPDLLGEELRPILEKIHSVNMDDEIHLATNFRFIKHKQGLNEFNSEPEFDLVYFDAFAPATEPDLWTRDTFVHLYSLMKKGGWLVTYCAKGSVKRVMKEAGFIIERLPGPPGKREMTRARKP